MARYSVDYEGDEEQPYVLDSRIEYMCERYQKLVVVECGVRSNGADYAIDLVDSEAWWIHDELCKTGKFSDGSKCSNWQASVIIHDVLKRDGHWIRAKYWGSLTFIFRVFKGAK